MSSAARVADRYLRGDAFIRLGPIPVGVPAGGAITIGDLEHGLREHGIEAHDLVLHEHDDDPPNVVRWRGRDANGSLVMGRLVLHLAYASERVVVSAEIVLATTTANSVPRP